MPPAAPVPGRLRSIAGYVIAAAVVSMIPTLGIGLGYVASLNIAAYPGGSSTTYWGLIIAVPYLAIAIVAAVALIRVLRGAAQAHITLGYSAVAAGLLFFLTAVIVGGGSPVLITVVFGIALALAGAGGAIYALLAPAAGRAGESRAAAPVGGAAGIAIALTFVFVAAKVLSVIGVLVSVRSGMPMAPTTAVFIAVSSVSAVLAMGGMIAAVRGMRRAYLVVVAAAVLTCAWQLYLAVGDPDRLAAPGVLAPLVLTIVTGATAPFLRIAPVTGR